MSLLDLFFPKYCVSCRKLGQYVCDTCFSYLSFDVLQQCFVCKKQSFDGVTHRQCKTLSTVDGVVVALVPNKTAKKLVRAFRQKPFVSELQHVLGQLCVESMMQHEHVVKLLSKNTVLVSLPLSFSAERKQGYNPSALLTKRIATVIKRPVEENGVTMQKQSVVLLVADVITETLVEVTRVLKKQGVQTVYAIALLKEY